MVVRFCAKMENKNKFNTWELYSRINNKKINLIDLGKQVFITGKVSYPEFTSCLQECINFGVVEVEIGWERR